MIDVLLLGIVNVLFNVGGVYINNINNNITCLSRNLKKLQLKLTDYAIIDF